MLADILTSPFVIKRRYQGCQRFQVVVSAVCAAIILIFGTVNMETVQPHELHMKSDKLSNSYKAVFLSDMHAGTAQSMDTTLATIERIGKEDADFILLGGDITDEYSTKEEMEQTYAAFGALDAPVYFIYGNHDRQPNAYLIGGRSYTNEELLYTLEKNGIQVLEDEWTAFSDELVFLGRDFADTPTDRVALADIPARPEGAYVITIDHSPYLTQDIEDSRADLQLSGHTHAGQLFPLQLVSNMVGLDAYGFYRHGQTDLFISSGVSGWRFPLRTEEGCRYEVITFEPAS